MELNSQLTDCANETKIILTNEAGLEDNTLYEYQIIVRSKIGTSTSIPKSFSELIITTFMVINYTIINFLTIVTTDVQEAVLTEATDYSSTIECHFINGSDARGCKVMIVSEHAAVDNITAMLMKASESDSIVSELLNLTHAFDCYSNVFAYDIEADYSIGSLAIAGVIEGRNITPTLVTTCTITTEGKTIITVSKFCHSVYLNCRT